jgi:hypothetical protein
MPLGLVVGAERPDPQETLARPRACPPSCRRCSEHRRSFSLPLLLSSAQGLDTSNYLVFAYARLAPGSARICKHLLSLCALRRPESRCGRSL